MPNQNTTPTYAEKYKIKTGEEVHLKDWLTDEKVKPLDKQEGGGLLKTDILKLSEIQEKLYASNRFSVLIVFQAMDAAGKDGVIKHVMSGLNPQGVVVTSFKTPTHQ